MSVAAKIAETIKPCTMFVLVFHFNMHNGLVPNSGMPVTLPYAGAMSISTEFLLHLFLSVFLEREYQENITL